MTVQANLPPTNTNSDGVTTTFEYDFKVTREEHLYATYTVIATGESGELEIDSVTGIGDDGGGTVTFAEAPADGMIITIDNVAPLSQIENFAGNRLPPETVERMGDAVVIQNQRQQSQINRTVRFPASDDEIPTLPARAQRADKILGFSADGSDFVMVEGAAASQEYVDAAKVQADRAVAAATYPYTSGETKSGAFMPGAGESLTLFTYNSVSDAAVTLPALAGLASGYNIGICRTAGSGDLTITADDGALINGAASTTLASDYLCLDLTINEAGDEWVAVDKTLIGLPVGTGARNIISLDDAAKLPAVDGSQLINVRDDTARDTALTTFIRAEILAQDPMGTYGKIISDNFLSDTMAVSTNAEYDAGGDYYINRSTQSVAAAAMTTNGSANAHSTVRQVVAASEISDGGATVSVTLRAHTSTGMTITEAYIGKAAGSGNAYDFDETPTALSFDGAPGAVIAAGAAKSSDFVDFEFEATDTLIVSYYISAGDPRLALSMTGWNAYYKNADDASTVDASGYTLDSNISYGIEDIRVAEASNMTLQSQAVTLGDADPSDITALFRVEDIDAVINGTDRLISFSIDNGATFSPATISELGAFGSDDTLIKATASVETQTGDQFVMKLVTANNKVQRIKQYVAQPEY